MGQGPRISVQVLNETLVNCRRKAGLGWEETGAFLAGIQALCPVENLTPRPHDVGRALAGRYGFSVYAAMIVAAALIAGCITLWSEDMQDGLVVEGQLRIVNPFVRRDNQDETGATIRMRELRRWRTAGRA